MTKQHTCRHCGGEIDPGHGDREGKTHFNHFECIGVLRERAETAEKTADKFAGYYVGILEAMQFAEAQIVELVSARDSLAVRAETAEARATEAAQASMANAITLVQAGRLLNVDNSLPTDDFRAAIIAALEALNVHVAELESRIERQRIYVEEIAEMIPSQFEQNLLEALQERNSLRDEVAALKAAAQGTEAAISEFEALMWGDEEE